jgi:prevent-host-death family protein
MDFVNVHEAKTNLSKYLDRVNKNHETIIICRNGIPVGQLTTYNAPQKRTLGLMKGKIKIAENFDEELPKDLIKDYL